MRRVLITLVLLLAFPVLLACEPSIGDSCETNLECPAGAYCDTTAPDGYCLILACEDNDECIDESVCVIFDEFTSFCMAPCSSNSDCREEYICRDDVGAQKFCYREAAPGEAPFERAESGLFGPMTTSN